MDKVPAWTSILVRAFFKNGMPKRLVQNHVKILLPYQE